jgi:hypothetical protein
MRNKLEKTHHFTTNIQFYIGFQQESIDNLYKNTFPYLRLKVCLKMGIN